MQEKFTDVSAESQNSPKKEEGQDVEARKKEAILFINSMITQVGPMGANDSEVPNLIRLIREVENGEMEPEKAKEEAYGIVSSKQDYH